MKRLLPGSVFAIAMAAAPAFADDSFDQYFAKRGKVCYARGYDATHLKQHAKQKISRIEIAFNKDAARGKPAMPSAFELRVGLMAKGQAKRFASTAHCSDSCITNGRATGGRSGSGASRSSGARSTPSSASIASGTPSRPSIVGARSTRPIGCAIRAGVTPGTANATGTWVSAS